jgi:hypothetical protein
MARMRMLGLALVAVLALAGLAASSASAAPEWKGCVKTEPKDTGRYADKLCTVESPGGEGAFELVPSVGKGKGFKGKGGATILHTKMPPGIEEGEGFPGPTDVEFKCTGVKYEGKLALPNLIKEAVMTFKGCALLGASCESGSKKGVIVTNSLAGEMVDIEGGSGVGTLLQAEAGPTAPLATFACRYGYEEEFETTNLIGSVIAERTGDVGAISKEAQEHFVVGPALGEVTYQEKRGPVKYTPLVNIPTHPTGGATGEHFLSSQIKVAGYPDSYALASGLEGVTAEKGEALMITP